MSLSVIIYCLPFSSFQLLEVSLVLIVLISFATGLSILLVIFTQLNIRRQYQLSILNFPIDIKCYLSVLELSMYSTKLHSNLWYNQVYWNCVHRNIGFLKVALIDQDIFIHHPSKLLSIFILTTTTLSLLTKHHLELLTFKRYQYNFFQASLILMDNDIVSANMIL